MCQCRKKIRDKEYPPANTDMRLNPCRIRQVLLPPAILATAVFLLLPACSGERTDLTGTQAWILEPSAEGISTGGLTVHNRTDAARILLHIMATDFRQANIRTKVGSNSPPSIIVEAHQTTELPPDGIVFLLEGPERPLHAGDKTLLALHFDDSQAIFINAEVRASSPSSPGSEP